MEFVAEIAVRFGDTDPAGVVYYPNFFHFYHNAFEEFFGATSDKTYAQWTQQEKIGFPTVHVEAGFDQALRYGSNNDPTAWQAFARLGIRSSESAG